MAQTINTNVSALNAQRNLVNTQAQLATSMQRLSSGLRVNSAKDDAAGMAIAERMNTQVRGLNVAIRNANDGISLAQTAEGGLQEISNMLQRMRELAVQSANGTNSTDDKANLDAEFQALNNEIGRIAQTTYFNGEAVLNTSAVIISGASTNASIIFQVGANVGSSNTLSIDLKKFESLTKTSGGTSGIAMNITTASASMSSITAIDTMIDEITTARANYGAVQSRLESAINNMRVSVENQAASRGRIMDADFAVETANLTRSQILKQVGTAMLAQANASPQSVLRLLV
jgi:flagellin